MCFLPLFVFSPSSSDPNFYISIYFCDARIMPQLHHLHTCEWLYYSHKLLSWGPTESIRTFSSGFDFNETINNPTCLPPDPDFNTLRVHALFYFLTFYLRSYLWTYSSFDPTNKDNKLVFKC